MFRWYTNASNEYTYHHHSYKHLCCDAELTLFLSPILCRRQNLDDAQTNTSLGTRLYTLTNSIRKIFLYQLTQLVDSRTVFAGVSDHEYMS